MHYSGTCALYVLATSSIWIIPLFLHFSRIHNFGTPFNGTSLTSTDSITCDFVACSLFSRFEQNKSKDTLMTCIGDGFASRTASFQVSSQFPSTTNAARYKKKMAINLEWHKNPAKNGRRKKYKLIKKLHNSILVFRVDFFARWLVRSVLHRYYMAYECPMSIEWNNKRMSCQFIRFVLVSAISLTSLTFIFNRVHTMWPASQHTLHIHTRTPRTCSCLKRLSSRERGSKCLSINAHKRTTITNNK